MVNFGETTLNLALCPDVSTPNVEHLQPLTGHTLLPLVPIIGPWAEHRSSQSKSG